MQRHSWCLQLAEADDVVSKHKEAKRAAEEQTADVRFKLQQAERRAKQEALATSAVQERLETAIARTREAEARLAEAEHEIADQASLLREWEARVRDSEDTCAVAEHKLQVRPNRSLCFLLLQCPWLSALFDGVNGRKNSKVGCLHCLGLVIVVVVLLQPLWI
jgi:multidrug resistance efflux pump